MTLETGGELGNDFDSHVNTTKPRMIQKSLVTSTSTHEREYKEKLEARLSSNVPSRFRKQNGLMTIQLHSRKSKSYLRVGIVKIPSLKWLGVPLFSE